MALLTLWTRRHIPAVASLVPVSGGDPHVKGTVLAKVEDFGHVVKVGSELLEARVAFGPVPCLVHFGKREAVQGQLRVDTGTRVAVETPDT